MKTGDYRVDRGSRREGEDPVWGEPDWDAPYRQPADLLPAAGRCETCLYWRGTCGLDTRRVRWAEDRCASWQQHPDHAEQVAWVMGVWKRQSKFMRAR